MWKCHCDILLQMPFIPLKVTQRCVIHPGVGSIVLQRNGWGFNIWFVADLISQNVWFTTCSGSSTGISVVQTNLRHDQLSWTPHKKLWCLFKGHEVQILSSVSFSHFGQTRRHFQIQCAKVQNDRFTIFGHKVVFVWCLEGITYSFMILIMILGLPDVVGVSLTPKKMLLVFTWLKLKVCYFWIKRCWQPYCTAKHLMWKWDIVRGPQGFENERHCLICGCVCMGTGQNQNLLLQNAFRLAMKQILHNW